MPKHSLVASITCKDGRMRGVHARDGGPEVEFFNSELDDEVMAKLKELVANPAAPEDQRDVALTILSRWEPFTVFLASLGANARLEAEWEYPDDLHPPWGDEDPPGGGAELMLPMAELQGLRNAARELVGASTP